MTLMSARMQSFAREVFVTACYATVLCLGITQHAPAQTVRDTTTVPTKSNTSPLRAATDAYRQTGIARPVQMGDAIAYPYGKSQPTLTCAALRTCLIELQPGEVITSLPARGDAERWSLHVVAWGPGNANPAILVKPLDCSLTTNLIVLTNRRIYDITLDAPACTGPDKADGTTTHYMRRLTFYYPDDDLTAPSAPPPTSTPEAASTAWESLSFAYHWTKDKDFPWAPDVVFDDGAHLYIKMPRSATHAVAPVLFALDEHGDTALLNYTVRNGFYVTDRVVPRAALVLGTAGATRRVTIERQRNTP